MDVERVQKINNLALELMNQGLIRDREEAIKQAERILAKKDCTSLNETMEEVREIDLNTGEIKAEKEKELNNEDIRKILERNTSFTVKKMKEYQEKIEELKKEIYGLRKEMGEMRYNISNMPREQPLKEAVKEEPQKKLEVEKKDPTNHPRSGNYEEHDISIEKFFYSGSKH